MSDFDSLIDDSQSNINSSYANGTPDGPIGSQFNSGLNSQPIVDNQAENQTTSPQTLSFDSLTPDESPNTSQPASFDDLTDDSEKHTTGIEQAKTVAEGLGQGLVGPLAPMAEKALGVDPEDIRAREEANPGEHYTGEILGLVAPGLLTGGAAPAAVEGARVAASGLSKLSLLTQAGLLDKIAFKGGETLAGRIGSGAAKAAIDNMLISGSDEASKMVLNDPNQSAETAMASIAAGGALGGLLGGALGVIPTKWSQLNGSKTGQLVADFKQGIADHIANPDPASAVQSELQDLYKGIKDVPVFGETGIKAEAIAKAMPEMNDRIANQTTDTVDKLEEAANDKLANDPHKRLIDGEIAKYKNALNSNDPAQIFTAGQDLKRQLQEWGKYNKEISPLAERPFRDTARMLASDLKDSLEDTGVWGDAAKIQGSINNAFTAFKPTLDDLESMFMTKVSGEKTFDPNKIQTYINQLGKPSSSIKMQKVENFVRQTEKYKDAINDTYTSVGADSPIQPTPLNNVLKTLQTKSAGAKLADAFIAKGLTDAGGKTAGAGVGALLGSMVGHGDLGAIIGAHALGPMFSSILPSIAGAIVKEPISATGFKAAADYSGTVAKSVKTINQAMKGVFKAGQEVLPSSLYPTKEQRDNLSDKLTEYQKNPQAMMNAQSKSSLNQYLPAHNMAMNAVAANAMQYLNSLKPNTDKQSPLDSAPVASSTAKAAYNNALDIANQPLIVLDKIKKGTVTASDLMTLSTIYPSLYKGLQQKLSSEMIDAVHKEEVIPYKTRMSLSLFLGQPMDSTMSPASIIAAQPLASQPQAPQGGMPKRHRSEGSKSSPALQKMPTLYSTPGQAGEARRSKVQ